MVLVVMLLLGETGPLDNWRSRTGKDWLDQRGLMRRKEGTSHTKMRDAVTGESKALSY